MHEDLILRVRYERDEVARLVLLEMCKLGKLETQQSLSGISGTYCVIPRQCSSPSSYYFSEVKAYIV